jgi:Zn-dependent M28 family amino/carboxypeptidase
MYKIVLALALTFLSVACSSNNSQPNESAAINTVSTTTTQEKEKRIPSFSKDSAFVYLKNQCNFGSRVPNTEAHRKCAGYLVEELKRFGAEVIEQDAAIEAYNGTILQAKNIIGQFYPEKSKRIILFAHWDSRPFSDYDPNPANHFKPVMGANDGASGVAVLLELARLLQQHQPEIGVDIVFFDAEDYGEPSFASSNKQDTWCLGSQYWGNNPHYTIKPQYGILLDMVGGRDPQFYQDITSVRMASGVLDNVWAQAQKSGYGDYFRNQPGGAIIDDHVYVNNLTGIPTIDIIDFSPQRGFPTTWHTVNDTPENIDIHTLGMVGQVVTTVVYSE